MRKRDGSYTAGFGLVVFVILGQALLAEPLATSVTTEVPMSPVQGPYYLNDHVPVPTENCIIGSQALRKRFAVLLWLTSPFARKPDNPTLTFVAGLDM